MMRVTASSVAIRYLEDRRLEGDEDVWELVDPVKFTIHEESYPDMDYEIPAGFDTDLASIPRVLWAVLPPFGLHLRASIVHDWLYAGRRMNRKRCDQVFRALMKEYKVGWFRRNLMYYAVRAFGSNTYRT